MTAGPFSADELIDCCRCRAAAPVMRLAAAMMRFFKLKERIMVRPPLEEDLNSHRRAAGSASGSMERMLDSYGARLGSCGDYCDRVPDDLLLGGASRR